jgi:kynurenine formamidase
MDIGKPLFEHPLQNPIGKSIGIDLWDEAWDEVWHKTNRKKWQNINISIWVILNNCVINSRSLII